MPRTIGSHTIDTGGIDKAALRAANAGLSAVQIFTAIPKYYGDKMSIRPERIKRFRAALEQANMQPTNQPPAPTPLLSHKCPRPSNMPHGGKPIAREKRSLPLRALRMLG